MLEKFEQLGNGACSQKLAFSHLYLYLKLYPVCGPPNLDLDTDHNDQKMENHLHQEEGNSNFNFNANLIFFKNGSKKKRTSVMEAGTGSRVMSPIQYRCKMAVTNADAGPRGSLLVGPVDQSGWFNFCWILVKKMINWTFKIFIVQLFFLKK